MAPRLRRGWTKRSNATLAMIGFLVFGAITVIRDTVAQTNDSGRIELQQGLQSVVFTTQAGQVRVNLPDDMSAGDTISGTVIAEPAGATANERATNGSRLEGYVVDVDGARASPKTRRLSLDFTGSLVPRTATLVLTDSAGKTIGSARVPVLPVLSTPANSKFQPPTFGQAGQPILISGPFDGKAENSAVRVGGNEAPILAESPRQAIALCPSAVTGRTTIEIQEQGTSSQTDFRVLTVAMSAPKLSLRSGEQTRLSVTVGGLAGLTQTVPLVLGNQSPSVVRLEGGDLQSLTIDPSQLAGSSVYQLNRNVTGVQPGAFTITARAKSTTPPQLGPGKTDQTGAPVNEAKKGPCIEEGTKVRAAVARLIKEYEEAQAANGMILDVVIFGNRGLGPSGLRAKAAAHRQEGDRLAAPYLQQAAEYDRLAKETEAKGAPKTAAAYRQDADAWRGLAKSARASEDNSAEFYEQIAKTMEENGVRDDDPSTPENELDKGLEPLRKPLDDFIDAQAARRFAIRYLLKDYIDECYGGWANFEAQVGKDPNHPDHDLLKQEIDPQWHR